MQAIRRGNQARKEVAAKQAASAPETTSPVEEQAGPETDLADADPQQKSPAPGTEATSLDGTTLTDRAKPAVPAPEKMGDDASPIPPEVVPGSPSEVPADGATPVEGSPIPPEVVPGSPSSEQPQDGATADVMTEVLRLSAARRSVHGTRKSRCVS